MFIFVFIPCIDPWDTHFVGDSRINDVSRACFVFSSPDNGGFPSNSKNNASAMHCVSGLNVHFPSRINSRVLAKSTFVYPTLPHALPLAGFRSLFFVQITVVS